MRSHDARLARRRVTGARTCVDRIGLEAGQRVEHGAGAVCVGGERRGGRRRMLRSTRPGWSPPAVLYPRPHLCRQNLTRGGLESRA
jgi:hypothetical protein